MFGFLGCAGVSNNITQRSPCAPLPRPVRAAWGGSTVYAGTGFHHTSFLMVPPEIYNKTHPEWFENEQLCWGNESLVAFVTQVVLRALRKQPDARFISVSQNDANTVRWRPFFRLPCTRVTR